MKKKLWKLFRSKLKIVKIVKKWSDWKSEVIMKKGETQKYFLQKFQPTQTLTHPNSTFRAHFCCLTRWEKKISNSNILQIFGIKSESRQSELWNIYESAIIVIRKLLWWVRCETTRGHITRHLWRVASSGEIGILQSYGHHLQPILIFQFSD